MSKSHFFIIYFFFGLITLSACQSDQVKEEKIVEVIRVRDIQMKNLLGINAFEWDFLQDPDQPDVGHRIHEPKFDLIKSFGMVRHYLDWEKLENKRGQYSFNPTNRGGWNYDVIYERSKAAGIDILACIKNTPDWLYNSYPSQKEQDRDHVPLPYQADREKPASYIDMARVAFQFAARYGSNPDIDPKLVMVNTKARWNGDSVNVVKIGLGTIKYIECNNEPDKWWKGEMSKQTGREYAANLSAFYDGHQGKLGKDVGVKTADSSIVVVMGGLGRPDLQFVKDMVAWCKENRGYRKDGQIDLCFDVINYHLYSNDNTGWFGKYINKKRGVAPELTNQGEIANSFVDYAETLRKGFEVWVTEAGYDLSSTSVQRAIRIGKKSAEITQADWMLRSSLLYARHGINRASFYQLYDTDPGGHGGIFGSSGFVTGKKRRPVADYFFQVKNLMGNYRYFNTINQDPFVDVYKSGKKTMYVLAVPDEIGREEEYQLDLGRAKLARIFELRPGHDQMNKREVDVIDGKLKIAVTETPLFVEAI